MNDVSFDVGDLLIFLGDRREHQPTLVCLGIGRDTVQWAWVMYPSGIVTRFYTSVLEKL